MSVSYYQKNIAKGHCGFCSAKVKDFNIKTGLLYKTCLKHRGSSKGKKNTSAMRWHSEGLCTDCGAETAINLKTGKKYWRCNACNSRQNRWARENHPLFRKCLDCDKVLEYKIHYVRCIECRVTRNKLSRKRWLDNQIATGICVRCKKNPIENTQECRPCANARSVQVCKTEKIRREKRKSMGVCVRCEAPVNGFHMIKNELVRYVECPKCYQKYNGGKLRKRLIEV